MGTQRVALVTGGSTGIGAALVQRFLDDGFDVVSLARRGSGSTGGASRDRLTEMQVDLFDADAVAQAGHAIAARFEVTHFVHNAGVIRANPVGATPAADLAALSQLHLGSALTLLQAVLPSMQAMHFGRIILMSSRAAGGMATRTAYAATKSGMTGMARTWALELAPHGITVNVVAPGPIAGTEMFHDVIPASDPRMAQLANSIPVQRLGTVQDVTNAVMFFASPTAGFVTGQMLYVCGGASIGSLAL